MNLKSSKRALKAVKAMHYWVRASKKCSLRKAKKWERIWRKRVRRLTGVECLEYIYKVYYHKSPEMEENI